ncbi:hypothetical protein KUCAC02_017526, partial [Chaenocephalus aceratus]
VIAGCHCRLQSRRLLYHAVPQALKPSEAFLSPPLSSPSLVCHSNMWQVVREKK